jgi:hypothetical protein
MIAGQFMSKLEFEFYTKLKNEGLVKKPIPVTIIKSDIFKALVNSKIIEPIQRRKGYIEIKNQKSFDAFYFKKFPNPDCEVKTEVDNQKKFKNTKSTYIEKERIIFIRGFKDIIINDQKIDLKKITSDYKLFSTVLQNLKAQKVCFVENLEPFLNIEKLLGDSYIYIHFYGRFPKKEILTKIECEEYLHFGDYDFVGLSEYIRASIVYKNAKLFIPDSFEDLFDKYSTPRKDKDTIYKNIKETHIKEVIYIANKITNSNKILEQQIVMDKL